MQKSSHEKGFDTKTSLDSTDKENTSIPDEVELQS